MAKSEMGHSFKLLSQEFGTKFRRTGSVGYIVNFSACTDCVHKRTACLTFYVRF